MRKPKNVLPPPAPVYEPSPYAKYLPTPDDSLRAAGAKTAELSSELNSVDREIERLEEDLKEQKEKRAVLGVIRHLTTVLPGPRTIQMPSNLDDAPGLCGLLIEDLNHLGWDAGGSPYDPVAKLEVRGPKA